MQLQPGDEDRQAATERALALLTAFILDPADEGVKLTTEAVENAPLRTLLMMTNFAASFAQDAANLRDVDLASYLQTFAAAVLAEDQS